jgi:hypothetical protein
MTDFAEIENELKKLRPAQPSAELFVRIEQALADCRASAAANAGSSGRFIWWRRRFTEWSRGDASDIDGQLVRARKRERASQTPYKFSFGLAAAAAAVLLLLARINMEQRRPAAKNVAQMSPATETAPVLPARGQSEAEGSTSADQFIPAGATQVVYSTLDEGLRFVNGSEAPMRRLRYQTHETLHWRNPYTGESLRVSYPSEEIVLLPVSGQ